MGIGLSDGPSHEQAHMHRDVYTALSRRETTPIPGRLLVVAITAHSAFRPSLSRVFSA